MKLIVEVGYSTYIMFEEFDAAVKALSTARIVTSEGYGAEAVYKTQPDSKITMNMVEDSRLQGCADSDTAALIEKIFKLKEENSKLQSDKWSLQSELEKIKKVVSPSKES